MIKDIKELNFPKYATLETATATIADMGDRTITSQVKIDGDVVPDFSYDWEVEFKGERYIHPIRKPQGTKENTSMSAKIDMVFQHWAIYEMKRQYFIEMSSTSAGVAVADKYIASLGLNLGDFVVAFNLVLNHYFGDRIAIRLNPNWQYDREAKFVSISYSYIWDVLQQIHEIYGVRWTLKTNAEGVCEILMGYPAEEVSHIFEYGFEGGLLSVQRQVQSTDIRNRILGRGGEKNLPLRYFKDKDPNNPLFEADPDWIPELANIAFTELRGKTFRDYVKGWKAKHYGGTVMAEPTEAYLAGYNAEKFDPVEYVEDKESIAKYGVLVGALENNEDIYPSIQGAPNDVDAIVDAEQVTDDDVDSAVENDSVTTNLESGHQTYRNAPANSTVTIETLTKRYFSVPEGKVGNLSMSLTATGKYSYLGDYEETHPILKSDTVKVTIHDKTTGAEVKSSSVPVVDIPAGDYYYMISADVETNYDRTSMVTLNIESVYLYTSTPNKSEGWSQTFDIWVRNIWGSTRNEGETDKQYADRIWAPILGDRTGGEARVIFASGWLSFSSDWEFPIVGYAYDDSKEGSHWRLTLAKSEAELEASGKYIPYEGYNASAGDRFFFIGIDMPYQYVLWAEERLDDSKRDSLLQTAEINPTWVIKTDKVRLNQDRDGAVLMDFLNAGSQFRLASKQFISGAYETLYVQSLTYNWSADTILYPDVEIVVSDKVYTVKNPVAQMQSNIETIQKQVGSLSNIQQIIRQVCDRLYLRKDGVEDLSKSPTRFLGKVTGDKFRQGQIGGRDWGIYRDENGNAILEADKIVARQGILVSDLVINEAEYVGGLQINSAASMKITAVEETEEGYICYFDQQQGSVTNKFRGDDIALCQKFDVEDNEVKYYKRRVVALTETSVTLSKAEASGTGIPAIDDEIIHYGNYTDKTRQFVIIRDVIGGGYERMLMGLDSVASDGVEYYFAGKSADSEARWFVGGTEQYAEYKNGQLTIKGNIFVAGSDNSINEQIAQLDFIRESFGENAQGLVLGTAIIVGYNDADGKFVPMAGLSGVFDEDKDNGGPAAWYGGTPDNAKSIIFMDGTGYFADGLFKWDKVKGVDLGDGAIKINYDGSVEFGPNIKISTEGDETLGTILTEIAKFNSWFELDEEAKMIKANYGLYAVDEMAAGGIGEAIAIEGGGLDVEELQNYLDENKYVKEEYVNEKVSDAKKDIKDNPGYYVPLKTVNGMSLYGSGNIKVEGGSGSEGLTAINVNNQSYQPDENGIVTLPDYPTVPPALKNPYALTFGNKTYNGGAAKTIVESDIVTDIATIRANATLGAKALQSVPSEYITETELNQKGYATTAALTQGLGGKVDKVSGKGLSTYDYTKADKDKLASLENYDDSGIKGSIEALESNFSNGKAKDADKLDGHDSSYFATSASVSTLQGYFTNGKANKAIADENGENISSNYAKQSWVTSLGYLKATEAAEIYATKETVGGINQRLSALEAWYDKVGIKISYDEVSKAVKVVGDFYSTGENSAGGAGEEILNFEEVLSRLSALEDAAAGIPKNIELGISKLSSYDGKEITSAAMASLTGLSLDVAIKMTEGAYNKVIDRTGNYAQTWNYSACGTSTGMTVQFRQGDGFDIEKGYSLTYTISTAKWKIIMGEI